MTKDEKYLDSLKIDSIDRYNSLLARKAFSPSNKYVQQLRNRLSQAPEGFPNNMAVAIDGGMGRVVQPQVVPQLDPMEGQRQYDKLVAENQPLENMLLGPATMGLGRMGSGTTPVANQLGKRPLVKMDAIPEERVMQTVDAMRKKKNLDAAISESRRVANKRNILEDQVKEELFNRNPKLRGQF